LPFKVAHFFANSKKCDALNGQVDFFVSIFDVILLIECHLDLDLDAVTSEYF
jgi:hypothetical protein